MQNNLPLGADEGQTKGQWGFLYTLNGHKRNHPLSTSPVAFTRLHSWFNLFSSTIPPTRIQFSFFLIAHHKKSFR